jgi:uncharacterized protein YndB with AHSA1/START domain
MKIEKSIVLKAPRSKVWRALTETRQFGEWFRARLEGEFAPGATVMAESLQPCHEDARFAIQIEEMTPERRFSWRWGDLKNGGQLVVFELDEVAGGTRLTVMETGFEALPEEKREASFGENTKGWEIQMAAIAKYVEQDR